MLAARAMDVSEFNGVKVDLAIALKFPAYFMQHPNKVYWVLHQHRQAYDLWDSGHTDLFDDPDGRVVREAIFEADNVEFGAAKKVFANSANVAKRFKTYNNISAEPLYHPPPLATRLRTGDFGDYFYYPSRIAFAKRQDFVLRALARSNSRAKVVFSGAPDNPAYGEELRKLAHDLGVAHRVVWKGFVTDAEMIELYAGARGILFTPIDEDLGYIALEAMLAGKPLLTLTDAGEPAALIRDAQEGFITPPDHQAFAEAMDRLADSATLAKEYGSAGLSRYRSLDISWTKAVEKLTGETVARLAETTKVPDTRKPEIVTSKAPTSAPASSVDDALLPSLDILAQRYDFGAHVREHRAWYDRNWPRYRATLEAIKRSGVQPRRILEIGTSPPYVFTTCLKSFFPDAQITVIQEGPAGLAWPHRIGTLEASTAAIDLNVRGLNVETTPLPFDEGHFDLVVAMEILEHFAIDPSHFFVEARRVLSEGGVALITTPNLISIQGVARALNGASPYAFGAFVPWEGAYGRHNREYTPQEVEGLGRYAGLETAILDTADIYPGEQIPFSLKEHMAAEGYPSQLRGQNIFYVGRKTAQSSLQPYPAGLFPVDPGLFSGQIELIRGKANDGSYSLRVTNTSRLDWHCEGFGAVCLNADRTEQTACQRPKSSN